MSTPDRSGLIDRYAAQPASLDRALSGVTAAMVDATPLEGARTIRWNVHHLLDATLVGALRIRAIVVTDGVALPAVDFDILSRVLGYEGLDIQLSANTFRALRTQAAAVLRALPDERWQHAGVREEEGPLSLAELIRLQCDDADGHLQEIADLRAALD